MSEPWDPQPAPEDEGETRGDQARCPVCKNILRRAGLDEYVCLEHGVVRPKWEEVEEG